VVGWGQGQGRILIVECVCVCVCLCVHICISINILKYVCMHVGMYVCLCAYIQLHVLCRIPYLRKGTAPVEPYDHTSRSRPRKIENTSPGNSVAVSMVHLCHCLPVIVIVIVIVIVVTGIDSYLLLPSILTTFMIFMNTFMFNSIIKQIPHSSNMCIS
jgi:hypothetical protein